MSQLTQTEPRDSLRHAHLPITLDGECDQQATVGRWTTTVACLQYSAMLNMQLPIFYVFGEKSHR